MRITINKDALLRAVQAASRVAPRDKTPELASVLIEAEPDGSASFSATDRDQSLRYTDMALVEEPGKALVAAAALARIVKSMPSGAVEVEASGKAASVACGKSRFDLPALDPRDWQGLPNDDDGPSCTIDAGVLQVLAKRITPFCSKDESKPTLMGVHVNFDGERLMFEATDSYRFARCWERAYGGDGFDSVVPPDFLTRAVESMGGEVTVAFDGNRIRLESEMVAMSTRAVEGRYPNGEMFLPKEVGFELSFCRDELLHALNRASQLGNGDYAMHLNVCDDVMRLDGSIKDAGSFHDEVRCDGSLECTVNSQFFRSCVEAMDRDAVTAIGTGHLKPMVLQGDSVWAVVMPIRG